MSRNKKEENIISAKLLQAFRSGDQSAYKTIYFTYKKSVQNFIKTLIGSEEDAEDLTQEVFVNIWKKKELLDPDKGIKGYLFTIAKNAALKFLNREKLLEDISDDIEYEVTPDNLLIAKETKMLMTLAIDQMPKQRRTIFKLSRQEGLSNEEIAERLSIKKENVAAHLSYAIRDLKKILTTVFILFLTQI